MKFNANDKVKVVHYDEIFNGKVGVITEIHYDLDIEPVYTIRYNGSQNSGMFPESNLELM